MVVKSYEQMTDVSIMEVKTYLLIHSDGIYQQDIYDLMNTCIDVFQLKRKLNKRKDIQLWLFSNIKRYIDCSLSYNEMGLKTFTPQGAFYVFPCIKSTGLTSEQFCEELLNDQLVACVPGSAFGEAGEGYIRVSYAYSLEELKAATKKIRKFLENKGVI